MSRRSMAAGVTASWCASVQKTFRRSVTQSRCLSLIQAGQRSLEYGPTIAMVVVNRVRLCEAAEPVAGPHLGRVVQPGSSISFQAGRMVYTLVRFLGFLFFCFFIHISSPSPRPGEGTRKYLLT
jgi:hypothetical protein